MQITNTFTHTNCCFRCSDQEQREKTLLTYLDETRWFHFDQPQESTAFPCSLLPLYIPESSTVRRSHLHHNLIFSSTSYVRCFEELEYSCCGDLLSKRWSFSEAESEEKRRRYNKKAWKHCSRECTYCFFWRGNGQEKRKWIWYSNKLFDFSNHTTKTLANRKSFTAASTQKSDRGVDKRRQENLLNFLSNDDLKTKNTVFPQSMI